MCPPKSQGLVDRALHAVGLRRDLDDDQAYHQACLEISQAMGDAHTGPNRAEDDTSSCHKTLVRLNLKKAYRPYPQDDPFYCLSSTQTALAAYSPGHILKYRSIDLTPFPGINEAKTQAWQVAYVYTDPYGMRGVSVLVVIVPPNSKRDVVIGQLPKTDAAIPQCRTSYSIRKGGVSRFGSLSESVFLANFLDKGWICFLPDYMGQQDSFGNGPLAARCTLDAARAVLNFAPLQLVPDKKLVFWGYSSGAQAVAWAASEQAAYAPELTHTIVGWAAGGLPVNPLSCAYHMNQSIAAGLIIGVMAGLSNVYPALKEWLAANLTPDGKKLYGKAHESCFAGFMIASLLKNVLGRTYWKQDEPLEDAVARQILDKINLHDPAHAVPTQPLWIIGSLHDEVVPIADLDKLVGDWGRRGGNIEYVRDRLSAHVILSFTGFPATVEWLQDRLNGKETHSKAGRPHIRTVDTSLWLDDDNETSDGQEVKVHADAEGVDSLRTSFSNEDTKKSISQARRRHLRQTMSLFKDKGYFY